MNSFEIKIEGFDRLMATLQALPKEVQQNVEDEFEAAAFEINALQKSRTPIDEGFLNNGISNSKTGDMTFEIVAQKSYAPYVEFGTKGRAVIPAELSEIAAQFKGGGLSNVSAKEAIYAWAKRHNIPEKRWYLVYRSIMTNGIRPHPFFFAPFFEVKPKLIERIKNVLVA